MIALDQAVSGRSGPFRRRRTVELGRPEACTVITSRATSTKPQVVVAGVVAQHGKGLLHVEIFPLGDHALGLLDDDRGC